MKRIILTSLLALLGEAFIISAMLLLPHGLAQDIMILDTVVLSIIWALICYDLYRPIISDSDHAPEVASIGIRWQGQLAYMVLAVGFGVAAGIYECAFIYQVLGQGGLLGILLFAWVFSTAAGHKASAVAAQEKNALAGRKQMNKVVDQLQNALADGTDIPADIRSALNGITDQLRYITPSDKQEAVELEQQFIRLAHEIAIALPHRKTEEQEIHALIARLERTLAQRKQIMN